MSGATLQVPVNRPDGQKGSQKGAFCSNILSWLRRRENCEKGLQRA